MTMTIYHCTACRHFDADKGTCPAYQEGVPAKYYYGDEYHGKVEEGQQGDWIFEPIPLEGEGGAA